MFIRASRPHGITDSLVFSKHFSHSQHRIIFVTSCMPLYFVFKVKFLPALYLKVVDSEINFIQIAHLRNLMDELFLMMLLIFEHLR